MKYLKKFNESKLLDWIYDKILGDSKDYAHHGREKNEMLDGEKIHSLRQSFDTLTHVAIVKLEKSQVTNAIEVIDDFIEFVSKIRESSFNETQKQELINYVKYKVPTLRFHAEKYGVIHMIEDKLDELNNI